MPCGIYPGYDLSDDWRINLHNNNLFFAGQGGYHQNDVGIGYECPPNNYLCAKLNVVETANNDTNSTACHSVAGFFENSSTSDSLFAQGVIGYTSMNTYNSFGVTGQAKGKARLNVGVVGVAEAGGYNIGVYGGVPPNIHPDSLWYTWTNWAGFFNGPVFSTVDFFHPSDSILKKDVMQISNSLRIIDSLKPRAFYYDTTFTKSKGLVLSGAKGYGFLAQEVQRQLPELVVETTKPPQYDISGNEIYPAFTFKSLNYDGFTGIIVQAIKDLDSLHNDLSERVTKMDTTHINFGAPCDSSALKSNLATNWKVGLNDKNLYFTGQGGERVNNLAIGYNSGATLLGKLNVKQTVTDTSWVYDRSITANFSNFASGYESYGLIADVDSSAAELSIGGLFTATSPNSVGNIGLIAIGSNGTDFSVSAEFVGDVIVVGGVLETSDSILKKNITPLGNAMSIIKQLKPIMMNLLVISTSFHKILEE